MESILTSIKKLLGIKSTTDYVAREAMMHEAEDMLMETGALCPLYYYNDIYMYILYLKSR